MPSGLVIVAQGWCNVLVVALLLKLQVSAVFMEAKMLKFIAPLFATQDVKLYILANVFTMDLPSPSVVVVSGSVEFFARLRSRLKAHDQVCWILQQDF
jgi:hypothetical protein